MAKRKTAARSDGRRAPSASASRPASRAAAVRPGSARNQPQARGVRPTPAKSRPPEARGPTVEPPAKPSRGAAIPSSLNANRRPSAARSGRVELEERFRQHHETGPGMTAGDIDADWESAYSVGDEAPGGDNPTPGQTVVEDVGRALGIEYEDGEELKASDKIESRDRHRWELDPASAEDYAERTKGGQRRRPRPSMKSEE
jgi:hypothetical protein